MRSVVVAFLTVGVLSLACGCGKKESTNGGGGGGGGYPTPEGTYLIVSIEVNGESMPEEFFSKDQESENTIRFAGNKLISTKRGKEDTIEVNYDTSKTPAHLTINGKSEKSYGIYKIESDTLTICVSNKEENRPKEFKTVKVKDGKQILLTHKKR